MPSDIPIRRLLQIRTEDWVNFVFPGHPKVKLKDMQTDLVTKIKQESRMDNVKWLDENSVVHFEPMGYRDYALPCRMLRYRADIWEYCKTINPKGTVPSIKQAVIFFFEKHDNGEHVLMDDTFIYGYKVIKTWEIDGADIINQGLVGLYPLLPLAKQKKDISDMEIIQSAINTINTVNDPVCKADLFAAMSILAAEKYSDDLVKQYIRRGMLMQSALFNEWVADFVEEAVEKAVEKAEVEIAAKLLRKGHTPDYVAEIVNFPVDKIEKIAETEKSAENTDEVHSEDYEN